MLYFKSLWVAAILFSSLAHGEEVILPLGEYSGDLVTVDAVLNNNLMASFIIDTGASYVVLGRGTFELMRSQQMIFDGVVIRPIRTVTANIVDGSKITMQVYLISSFALSGCVLHDVEVAVNTSDYLNIIGWSVLHRIQPFTVDRDNMIIRGSKCE